MGLEKVKEKVLDEAKQKAKSRLDSAKAEARDIVKAISKNASEKEASSKKQIESEIELIKNREAAAAKLDSRKLSLAFRKKFIDEMFGLVKEKLEKLPDAARDKHVKKLLEKAKSEIDVAVVHCNKQDCKFVDNAKVTETDILGGIIAESADGSLRVDYSYETMLKQLKDSMLPELNEMLLKTKK